MGAESLNGARRDAWLWRLCATGLAFVIFGVGGLVLRLLVFPLQSLLPGDAQERQRRARSTIKRAFRFFVKLLVVMRVMDLEFKGVEKLGRAGQLIFVNHPTLLDVVLVVGYSGGYPNCIVRHGLSVSPFMRGPIRAAGYITNDEGMDMLERAAEVLRQGEPLIIFPEGTRTAVGAMPSFHRGASAIALRGAAMVTPVLIRTNARGLSKGDAWYRIPRRRLRYVIEVGDDIDPAQWRDHYPPPLASRKMNDFLHDYFLRGLTRNECT
ncbi:MAG: 1-acyl-sn-glycerol-3-phosphate acyltransferase [Pseudomonadales bacterium]|jgi:1-acyl-sn-glycerol-3-phosphate acyltransferase|nr:1-acyl-sn-glycerol-3-phosphate acyltransferase [Pseudomonadales bacterium]